MYISIHAQVYADCYTSMYTKNSTLFALQIQLGFNFGLFEEESHSVVQAGFELTAIFLLRLPEFGAYRCDQPSLTPARCSEN